jgi:hypothetical protein
MMTIQMWVDLICYGTAFVGMLGLLGYLIITGE